MLRRWTSGGVTLASVKTFEPLKCVTQWKSVDQRSPTASGSVLASGWSVRPTARFVSVGSSVSQREALVRQCTFSSRSIWFRVHEMEIAQHSHFVALPRRANQPTLRDYDVHCFRCQRRLVVLIVTVVSLGLWTWNLSTLTRRPIRQFSPEAGEDA